jgi:hypothetical protein
MEKIPPFHAENSTAYQRAGFRDDGSARVQDEIYDFPSRHGRCPSAVFVNCFVTVAQAVSGEPAR